MSAVHFACLIFVICHVSLKCVFFIDQTKMRWNSTVDLFRSEHYNGIFKRRQVFYELNWRATVFLPYLIDVKRKVNNSAARKKMANWVLHKFHFRTVCETCIRHISIDQMILGNNSTTILFAIPLKGFFFCSSKVKNVIKMMTFISNGNKFAYRIKSVKIDGKLQIEWEHELGRRMKADIIYYCHARNNSLFWLQFVHIVIFLSHCRPFEQKLCLFWFSLLPMTKCDCL